MTHRLTTLARKKDYTWISTINAGTLRDKVEELIDTMDERGISLMGVAETRWRGEGRKILHNDYQIIYKGNQDNTKNGVAIIMSPNLSENVEKIFFGSDRIIGVVLKIKDKRYTFIEAYAPQQGRPREEKIQFYDDLQEMCDTKPPDGELIIMGDLNGHIGSEKLLEVIGNFGVGEINEGGEMLIDFCVRNNLSIMNTFFRHQESHQYTWYRWNSRTGTYDQKSQIDFIITNKKSIVKDVKAIPSISFDSDHRMVKGKFMLPQHKKAKTALRKRVCTENIKNVKNEIIEHVAARMELMTEEHHNIEDQWKEFKSAAHEIQDDIIGTKSVGGRKVKKTAWWTEEVKHAVKNKMKAFRLWLRNRTPETRLEYENQRRTVNITKRQAQATMWENIGNELEQDFGNSKKLLYSMAKSYRGKSAEGTMGGLRDKNGNLILDIEMKGNRWNEYFSELFNIDAEEDANGNYMHQDEDVTVEEPISLDEIRSALKGMKNNKSAGPDSIPIETIKAGGERLLDWLRVMFNEALESGVVPEDWSHSYVCPIFKGKGDPAECKNYRGISLISHVAKLYEKILDRRVKVIMEQHMSECQAGFRQGRGTIDQISALRMYMEKSWEYNLTKCVCFVDLEKAFDRIPRAKMWGVLTEMGVPNTLLRAIKSTYIAPKSSVVGTSSWFQVNTGVKQGSILSPTLFIMYFDKVIKQVEEKNNLEMDIFAYADDLAIVTDSGQMLNTVMEEFDAILTSWGLKLSCSKTKFAVIGREPDRVELNVNGNGIDRVDCFEYLGSKISANTKVDEEVFNRISKYSQNTGALYPLLRNIHVPRRVKLLIYTSILKPILLYGSETWALTERLKNKLQAAEMRTLRLIYGITKRDRVRNVEVRRQLGVDPLILEIEKSQLRWLGHLLRMPPERKVKQLYEWKPDNRRPVGRPRVRWTDNIKKVLSREDVLLDDAADLCGDRVAWRRFVKELSTDRLT